MGQLVSYSLWPLLMAGSIAATAVGIQVGHPVLGFNLTYFALAFVLFLLERWRPHAEVWLRNDGQMGPDLGHTVISKASVQLLIVSLAVIGAVDALPADGGPWWPKSLPLAVQVLLGLALAEFGFYWAHRLGHEWPLLWRFHAVHHSVKRLWFFNTGRFHFVDTVLKVTLGMLLGVAVGVPRDIIVWVSAITAFVGLLTHCNIRMRGGWLSYLFNTPDLHRWHHSMNIEEGNKNYGENLMIFDHLFGTYFNPKREPPLEIGIRENMPATLSGQILFPFRAPALEAAADSSAS